MKCFYILQLYILLWTRRCILINRDIGNQSRIGRRGFESWRPLGNKVTTQ